MNFTLSYLAAQRLGELAGLEPSMISPMHDLTPTIAEIRNGIDGDILGRLDDILAGQKLIFTDDGAAKPASGIRGFLGALFAPEKCIQSRLHEPDGCSDTYFILYDGAWLRLDAVRGQFTVNGPLSERAVKLCLRADAETALSGENIRFLAEMREPELIRSAVIFADEAGYQFFGDTLIPGKRSHKTYVHPFAKTEENRKWVVDITVGDREFVLPESERSGDTGSRKGHSALKGFLVALAVDLAAGVIISVLRVLL